MVWKTRCLHSANRRTPESLHEVAKDEIYNLCPTCFIFALFDPDRISSLFCFRDIDEKDSWIQTFNIAWNFLAIFWFLPYTILVILLLARIRGKSFAEVKRLFLSAPVRLMMISPLSYAIVLIICTIINLEYFENLWRFLLWAVVISIPASLLLGYAFIGISLVVHNLLLKIGVVRDDDSYQMG